jgi:hypothetical protein
MSPNLCQQMVADKPTTICRLPVRSITVWLCTVFFHQAVNLRHFGFVTVLPSLEGLLG